MVDILRADLDPAVLDDPDNIRIDYVGLCYMLCDLLQWQVQQPPDENPVKQRGLVNAWVTVIRGMSSILLALQPAVGLDVGAIRPLVPKLKSLEIPTDIKAATDELLLTLQTVCLGSASASRAIAHWEGIMAASKGSLRSSYGSENGDPIHRNGITTNGISSDMRTLQDDTATSSVLSINPTVPA